MIDPMTQQKKNDMEKELAKHSCPYCGCDFKQVPNVIMDFIRIFIMKLTNL